MKKRIVILGSSGSIGMQTLDVISDMKNDICVVGLAVNFNIQILKIQIKKFKPVAVSVCNSIAAKNLKKWCFLNNIKTCVYSGNNASEKLVVMPNVDMVIAAMVGTVGLKAIIAAIAARKNIAIANKEVIVMAGKYIMNLATKNNISIIPIDSEHSAIFQCRVYDKYSQIKKIILTASGGPFYKYKKDFSKITVNQTLKHPIWNMGKKITVDSATLMNKGLEVIEASILFGIPVSKIEVVIHPQSIIHSMVEYIDGSVIAYLSNPDMRLPIQYALTYPEKLFLNIKPLNFLKIKKLQFYKPNFDKFPCLDIAYYVAKKGYTLPAVMNAANEISVEAFLNKKIRFTDIARIIKKTVMEHKILKNPDLKSFVNADLWARNHAKKIIKALLNE